MERRIDKKFVFELKFASNIFLKWKTLTVEISTSYVSVN